MSGAAWEQAFKGRAPPIIIANIRNTFVNIRNTFENICNTLRILAKDEDGQGRTRTEKLLQTNETVAEGRRQ